MPPVKKLSIRQSYPSGTGVPNGKIADGLYSYNNLKCPKGYKIATTSSQIRLMTLAKSNINGYSHKFDMFLGEGY